MNENKRNDFHGYLLEKFGAPGEALYMGALGFIAIAVNGFAAYLLEYPLLFPSLAPTVFLIFRSPLSADASPRNAIIGHFVGLLVGFLSLAIFGLLSAPGVIEKGATTLSHVAAAAVSLTLAEAILIVCNRPHPPAATTTLLVSLGIFKTFSELLSLAAGILLLTATCWALNRSLGVLVPRWSPRK